MLHQGPHGSDSNEDFFNKRARAHPKLQVIERQFKFVVGFVSLDSKESKSN